MKTVISLPDSDFERFERIAALHGMSRSDFYRRAGHRLADELDAAGELTALANGTIVRSGQPADGGGFLRCSERSMLEQTEW